MSETSTSPFEWHDDLWFELWNGDTQYWDDYADEYKPVPDDIEIVAETITQTTYRRKA